MHYYIDLKINIVQRHDDGLFYNAAGTTAYERDWIIEDGGGILRVFCQKSIKRR